MRQSYQLNPLGVSIKNLRIAMDKTQSELGRLIGKSLATVQRYENLCPPKGRTLLSLERVALDSGLVAHAATFRRAFQEEMGL